MQSRSQSGLATTLPRLIVVLLVAAAMVRGLLPAGYMLAPSADARSVVLEMCGSGAHAYRLDLATGRISPLEDPAPAERDAPTSESLANCPFAIASSPALSGGQISVPLPATSAPADLKILTEVSRQRTVAGLPPPARGPPARL